MRRIVYFGNCQMEALRNLHTQFVTPSTGDVVWWANPYRSLSKADHAAVAAADLIVGQVNGNAMVEQINALPGTAVRHLVPTVAASFLWPFAGQAHARNLRHGPFQAEQGDAFLNRMIKQNVPVAAAVERYLALDINAMLGLDRLLELNIEQQQRRDGLTGYRFSDIIFDGFRDTHLFLSPYHPNTGFVRSWAAEIWQRIDVGRAAIKALEDELVWSPFPLTALPIHPSVIRHFGLRFPGETPRYRCAPQGSVTFAEFAERYLRLQWNDDLDAGAGLRRSGKHAEAADRLCKGLELAPTSIEGIRQCVEMLVLLKRPHDGIEIVRRAIALDPGEAFFSATLAALLLAAGELDAAEAAARQSINLAPGSSACHTGLARILVAQGRFDEAEAALRRAAELDPLDHGAHAHLAALLMKQERLDAAETAWRDAVAAAPANRNHHLNLSRLLLRRGQPADAVAAARAAVKLGPQVLQTHLQFAAAWERAGNPAEAELALRQGIAALPGEAQLWTALGSLLDRRGQPDGAIEAAKQAIVVGKPAADHYSRLAHLLMRAQRFREAEVALEQAIALASGVADLHFRLSLALQNCGDHDRALQAIARALQLAPDRAGLHYHNSLLLAAQDLPAALEAAQRAVSIAPNDTLFHTGLGHLAERAGRFEDAEAAFARAVALAPARSDLRAALERLQQRRMSAPTEPVATARRAAPAVDVSAILHA